MNTHGTPSPTGLPGQSGITAHLPVPLPVPPVELYMDPRGYVWKLVEDGQDGRLFVPEQVNPASCPRMVWAREAELLEFVGPLTLVERAA
ncbi:hypothetical protein ACFVHW_32475 [Streptomyces sp. NPDC127110]|uniref:hypothetical protein n=1 Tax=Streptomyces sp. NPDC127110 TaxID=3345362 RepID=UPI00363B9928